MKETVLIEKTSKSLKALNALSTGVLIGSIMWFFSSVSGIENDVLDHNAKVAVWLVILGILLKITSKTMIWWNHG